MGLPFYRGFANASAPSINAPVIAAPARVAGDLLIVATVGANNPPPTPSGWTYHGVSNSDHAIFYRIALNTSADDFPLYQATAVPILGTMFVFGEVDQAAPFAPAPPALSAMFDSVSGGRVVTTSPSESTLLVAVVLISSSAGFSVGVTPAMTFRDHGQSNEGDASRNALYTESVTSGSHARTFAYELGDGEAVAFLAALNPANNPPTAPTVTAPNGGETYTGTHSITWTGGTDADGDAITYDVELSRNNGGSWTRIGTAVAALSLVHDFTGSASGLCKVRVRSVDVDGLTSAWDESNAVFTFNRAPNAPALGYPSGGQTIDRANTLRLNYTFSDPDAGDSQSAQDIRYRLVGAPSWTTLSATRVNQFRDFAGGTFAAGDYEWQARTTDALGAVGPYSASGFFTAVDAPAGPSITAPTNGGTVDSNPYTVTWSAAEQDAYQLRTVADDGLGSPDTGTIYTDTGTVESVGTRSLAVAFPANGRDEHVQLRVRYDALWSSWASHMASVDYTAPAVPAVIVTADDEDGAILLQITHPTPAGSEPAVTTQDVYVVELDEAGAATTTPSRVAAGMAAGEAWWYRSPASGVAYGFQVRANGVNGTSSLSAVTG